jgi:hypothetical protein
MTAGSTLSRQRVAEIGFGAFAWFGVALLAGCASSPALKHDSLSFLESGHVTQDEVRAHLGDSVVTFEHGHVFAYRLRRIPDGYEVVARTSKPGWEGVDYDLVLAFDDGGVLRDHSLVAIHAAPTAK